MSLVFAAITPHPPLLIPTIGGALIKKIEKTLVAMRKLEEDLYLAKPDALLIISPHAHSFVDAFNFNIHDDYVTNLKQFGDLATKIHFRIASSLAANVQRATRNLPYGVKSISEKTLDHGAAVPLFYLTTHLPKIGILPVAFCDLDWKTHVDFGTVLKDQIMKSNQRIAVIASGDLSHALTTDAPAGFNAAGIEFDNKIQELLATRNTAGMLSLDPQFVGDAAECGFRSFLILMGILRDVHYEYQSYAYEGPFGVGYLTANFVL